MQTQHMQGFPAKTIPIALINRALQGMITSGLVAGFITKTPCFSRVTVTNRDKSGNEKAPGLGAGGANLVPILIHYFFFLLLGLGKRPKTSPVALFYNHTMLQLETALLSSILETRSYSPFWGSKKYQSPFEHRTMLAA
jgi:hypothetical protein